eukprot:605681-Hanusia_phi.AAC.2
MIHPEPGVTVLRYVPNPPPASSSPGAAQRPLAPGRRTISRVLRASESRARIPRPTGAPACSDGVTRTESP